MHEHDQELLNLFHLVSPQWQALILELLVRVIEASQEEKTTCC